MKIEVSKHGALLAAVGAILVASIVLVSAYNNPLNPQANPSYVGHSIDEIDWSQTVSKATFTTICLAGSCITSWPAGGAVLPTPNTCPTGQYVKGLNTDGTVVCGAPPCNPITQAVACSGKNCGYVSDGCTGTYTCGTGTCSSGYTCTNNVCVCVPIPFATACSGKNCGTVNNGCGGTYTCGTGTCSSGYTCTNNVCTCTPIPYATACAGKTCGTVSNGCGGSYTCGSYGGGCPSGQICSSNTCVTPSYTWKQVKITDYKTASTICGSSTTCRTVGGIYEACINSPCPIVKTINFYQKNFPPGGWTVPEITASDLTVNGQTAATLSCTNGQSCTGYGAGSYCVRVNNWIIDLSPAAFSCPDMSFCDWSAQYLCQGCTVMQCS